VIFLWLAALVALVHLGFILLVVAGGWLVRRRPRFAWVHLPAVAWGAWIEFTGRVCPLTPLERWLRARAGAGGFSGDFLDHYVVSLIYPPGLTRDVQIALGVAVIVVNAIVYARAIRGRAARTGNAGPGGSPRAPALP